MLTTTPDAITTKEKLSRKYSRLSVGALEYLLDLWTERHKQAPRLDEDMTKHNAFYHCAAIRRELKSRGH